MAAARLFSLGEIAKQLRQREHRIRFVIESRGIEPNAIAGHVRVWSGEDVARIKAEIDAIDAAKGAL